MTRVIADENWKAGLRSFAEPLGICDESGRILGFFQPAIDPETLREVYDWAKTAFTEEELEEARRSTVWYTTGQVLGHLRSL